MIWSSLFVSYKPYRIWKAYPVVRLFNRREIPTCPFPIALPESSSLLSTSSPDPSSSSNLLFLPVPFCILDLWFPSISRSFKILFDLSRSFMRPRNKPSRYAIALCLFHQLMSINMRRESYLLSSFGAANTDADTIFPLSNVELFSSWDGLSEILSMACA